MKKRSESRSDAAPKRPDDGARHAPAATQLRVPEIFPSQDSLNALLAAIPGVVYQFQVFPDDRRRFLYLSPGIEALYEIAAEVVYANADALIDCIFPEDRAAHRASLETACRTLTPWTHEHRIRTSGERIKWVRGQATPTVRADGSVLWIGILTEITAIKQVEEALRLERDSNRNLLETVEAIIVAIDPTGRIALINRKGCQLLGYDVDELIGQDWFETCLPATVDRSQLRDVFRKILAGDLALSEYFENFVLTRSGAQRLIAWHNGTLRDPEGRTTGVLAAGEDITERKLAEAQLQLAASVFTHAREGILITTPDGAIIEVNDAFCRITGYSRDEVLGRNPRLLGSGLQDRAFFANMWRILLATGHWSGEIWNQRKSGELFAVIQTISVVHDKQGAPRHYVALFSDITAIKEQQRQLERIAHYDALTRLPNRVLLAARLHQDMKQTRRREKYLGVAYLDLDGFKLINDTYGHAAGDQTLIAAAQRMKSALREGDTIARLGGDEFVAVLIDLNDIDDCIPLLNRLLAAAAEPLRIGELTLQVSASIGVTFYPQAAEADGDQLLRQADQAMYQAKQSGKNRFRFFDTEQHCSARSLHENLERIHLALERREFALHYQPQVNLRTGAVIGAEALIRWNHPERGLLLPEAFLPLIENHPLAINLGEWVIATVLAQMEDWRRVGVTLPISVNLGTGQLQQSDFVERLRALLATQPDVDPSHLALEILETSAMENIAHVAQTIDVCRALGVTCALDNFGTGYSSLTYLKHLAVSLLKIDRSFVRNMLDDPENLAIVESVVRLATAFRRQVLAEGVETPEHGTLLLRLGCELAQGFGIARPMPAREVPDWLIAWQPPQQWHGLQAMRHDDLPLLIASVEHRAWILAIEKQLLDDCDAPLPLDHRQCRFGTWLYREGLPRYGAQPAFQTLVDLHHRVHTLALALRDLHAQGRKPEARTRLDELHALRDRLLEQLDDIVCI